MNKPKTRVPPTQLTGVYKPESVRDVAESLNIASLADPVASALASDVEYRLHQVVQEAARFMRHARRTALTTADVDNALRTLNIEPLYGHFSHSTPAFRRANPFPALPAAGPVYFVEDEELDFDRVVREDKITLPKGPTWTAHWLAVEGVQPLVPENPPALPKHTHAEPPPTTTSSALTTTAPAPGAVFPPTPPSSDRPSPIQAAAKKQQQQQQHHQQPHQLLVKQVLSRELQLYYTRLTTALLPAAPADHAKRAAALASLRNDAGLQALLPYLVRWVAEGVVAALKAGVHADADARTLAVLLDVISALLDNPTLFVEPYLHQLLPPILSTLLHASLPPQHAPHLRTTASHTLSRLLTAHSTTYPSLPPRIMKTLLLALLSPGKPLATRDGAIRGLVAVGKEAVRRGVVAGGGARVVGSEVEAELSAESGGAERAGEKGAVVESVMAALKMLHEPSADPVPLDLASEPDAAVARELREVLGGFFAERLVGDAGWARAVLSGAEREG